MEVDAFTRGIGGEQHLHLRIVPERLLGLQTLLAAHATMDDDHRVLAPKECAHTGVEVTQGVAVLGKEHELLAR